MTQASEATDAAACRSKRSCLGRQQRGGPQVIGGRVWRQRRPRRNRDVCAAPADRHSYPQARTLRSAGDERDPPGQIRQCDRTHHCLDSLRPGALLWLQQLLQGYHILLHALLHDPPRIVTRLRFHLGKLAEIRDRLLYALLCGLGSLRDRLGACGVFDCRLPFRQRFAEDLVVVPQAL